MRFMLLQNYGSVASGMAPMPEWSEADIQAHIEFQIALNRELTLAGELLDPQGLSGPEAACFVTSDGQHPPVVSDGPFPETKELVAGYRLIQVDSRQRAAIRPTPGRSHRHPPCRRYSRSSTSSSTKPTPPPEDRVCTAPIWPTKRSDSPASCTTGSPITPKPPVYSRCCSSPTPDDRPGSTATANSYPSTDKTASSGTSP